MSPLNQNRPFQFILNNNNVEYWEYLCFYDKEFDRSIGLLFFVKDFYTSVAGKSDSWGEDLCEVTTKIRDLLFVLADKLDLMKDTYGEAIINLDNLLFAVNEAVMVIPDLNKVSHGKKGKQSMFDIDEAMDFGQEEQEKIIRMVSDYIYGKNLGIRACFEIESFTLDVLVQPYFMKRKLKEICGENASFKEIDWFIRKLMQQTVKKQ